MVVELDMLQIYHSYDNRLRMKQVEENYSPETYRAIEKIIRILSEVELVICSKHIIINPGNLYRSRYTGQVQNSNSRGYILYREYKPGEKTY